MNTTENGLALLCDVQGRIVQVFRNDLSILEVVPGHLFPRLVDQASRFKALNFINELNTRETALDWELNILVANAPINLHFSGGRLNGQLLIVGATNGNIAMRLYDDMLLINNEQTNLLRAVLKENSRSISRERDAVQYDEISRLNNELVSMQRELTAKNSELTRLDNLKNQFLGMAAHDLRSPLQGILFYSAFMLDDSEKLDAEQIEFLTVIRDQSQYMASLVNDLLDVAIIESGKLQLDLQPVDLVRLAQTNLNRNRLIAARKNITLDLKATPIPVALLDAAKMEQALDNLTINAIKYSPPGSNVCILLDTSEEKILLSVQDEGPGIPPAEMEKLFKPFQRTSVKSSGGEKSTGLGLVIVKRIVVGHGGRIWVENQIGVGCTFFVEIPILK